MDRANGHVWRMGLVPLIPRLQTFVENCSTTGKLILRTTTLSNIYYNIPDPCGSLSQMYGSGSFPFLVKVLSELKYCLRN